MIVLNWKNTAWGSSTLSTCLHSHDHQQPHQAATCSILNVEKVCRHWYTTYPAIVAILQVREELSQLALKFQRKEGQGS